MLTLIKRQKCLEIYPKFPIAEHVKNNSFFYPDVFTSNVVTVHSKSIKGHLKLLGKALIQMMTNFGYDRLIFLGDSKIPWLYQNNNYKPVKEAMQYLIDNKIGKRFNGAVQVDAVQLLIFLKHLFWLTRCNASLPYFYFMDEAQNFIGHICKHGNLHLDSLNETTDNLIKTLIAAKTDFRLLDTANCYDSFGRTSNIQGRKIVV